MGKDISWNCEQRRNVDPTAWVSKDFGCCLSLSLCTNKLDIVTIWTIQQRYAVIADIGLATGLEVFVKRVPS